MKNKSYILLTDICIKRTEEYWNKTPETPHLQEAVDEVSKVLIEHFKTDKHTLRADYYATELAEIFIGIEPVQLLASSISKYADLAFDEENNLVFVAKKVK